MRFNINELIAQAQTQTDLTEWGGEDFPEGLQILLDACSKQAGLSEMGYQHLTNMCIHHLKNRLRIQDVITRHPEILDEEIKQPMFLATFPRSGSTFLHRLLCQDPNIRVPLYGEMWQPAPDKGIDPSQQDRLIRLRQASDRFLQPLDDMFPENSAAIGTMPASDEPGECYVLFENSFTSFHYTFDYYIPDYLKWLKQLDFHTVYEYFKKQLKVLQFQFPGQPWCMKCADHLLGIDGLLDVFPDANIVMIHRDPQTMVPSLANLQSCYMNLWREDEIDANILGSYCLERYQSVVNQAATLRDRVKPKHYHELTYQQLVKNPIQEIQRLMKKFDYPVHVKSAQRIQHWLHTHPKPNNQYSLDAYGLEPIALNKTLAIFGEKL